MQFVFLHGVLVQWHSHSTQNKIEYDSPKKKKKKGVL